MANKKTAKVIRIQENILKIKIENQDIMKNEVVFVKLGENKLKAEVLRVKGKTADIQVYEDTKGVKIGDDIELSREMLSVTLGPGLLGQVFDGLQNPLEILANKHGFFLPRGDYVEPLNPNKKWSFKSSVEKGAKLKAGDVIGTVKEINIDHKIMIPFSENGEVEIISIKNGSFKLDEPIAKIKDSSGNKRDLILAQNWPIRKPIPQKMLRNKTVKRLYPSELLTTTTRVIDTFFPIAKGGTACIPGPFGAGKTVLQSLLSRYASVDIVIVVACGERAGEVVETITEFPEMIDPKTGGSLMDRTIIICNTSSMPVASRESSIYTGMTIGEYYRQMGLDVLLIADSTSRWAQALRETSGRLEEIPGEEAFPAYLDSSIKGVYERAGVIEGNAGTGSLTMVGTVSPAGGNFEEPVTQSTLGTVKTFLGLSYDRAYKRFYPAIDPLISWSRYREQLHDYFENNLEKGWNKKVNELEESLEKSARVYEMMQVTGEEGVSLEDFIILQKGTILDMAYLQQDAFDDVDVSVPIERQKEMLNLIYDIYKHDFNLETKEEVRRVFTKLTSLFKNLNYSSSASKNYNAHIKEIREMLS
ncbi:MAG: V-type ATP synthase subunit A [Alphaproteobacteria bacterium]|jgi:V/A-type H+-transporting ATPase subunit A|nr:V-type ATP synthase subunit A [Alphaproteobacteria bacterium]